MTVTSCRCPYPGGREECLGERTFSRHLVVQCFKLCQGHCNSVVCTVAYLQLMGVRAAVLKFGCNLNKFCFLKLWELSVTYRSREECNKPSCTPYPAWEDFFHCECMTRVGKAWAPDWAQDCCLETSKWRWGSWRESTWPLCREPFITNI